MAFTTLIQYHSDKAFDAVERIKTLKQYREAAADSHGYKYPKCRQNSYKEVLFWENCIVQEEQTIINKANSIIKLLEIPDFVK